MPCGRRTSRWGDDQIMLMSPSHSTATTYCRCTGTPALYLCTYEGASAVCGVSPDVPVCLRLFLRKTTETNHHFQSPRDRHLDTNNTMRSIISLIILVVLPLCASFAFVPSSRNLRVSSSSTLQMTLLNYKGKKVEVKEGTPLSQACVKLGLQPKYSCKE